MTADDFAVVPRSAEKGAWNEYAWQNFRITDDRYAVDGRCVNDTEVPQYRIYCHYGNWGNSIAYNIHSLEECARIINRYWQGRKSDGSLFWWYDEKTEVGMILDYDKLYRVNGIICEFRYFDVPRQLYIFEPTGGCLDTIVVSKGYEDKIEALD